MSTNMDDNTNRRPRSADSADSGQAGQRQQHTTGEDWSADHEQQTPGDGYYRDSGPLDRESVVQQEKDEHGGLKMGSGFFGWLTATGMIVLLAALLTAIAAVTGRATDITVNEATTEATNDPTTAALVTAIVGLVVLFIGYFCGGYVAGRMARFDGLKQGFAVWLWAVIVAVVVAVLGFFGAEQFDVLAQVDSMPKIPVLEDNPTIGSVIAVAAIAVVALIGALLGGGAGMRFHRKVDRTGLGN